MSTVLSSPRNRNAEKFKNKFDNILTQISNIQEKRGKKDGSSLSQFSFFKKPTPLSQLNELKNEISIKKIKPLTNLLFLSEKNKQIPVNSLSLKINVNSPCYTQRVRNEASLSTLRSMSSENNLLMSSKKFNEFFEEHDIRPLSSRHKPYYTQKRAENKEKIKQMKISIQKSLNLFRK